MQIIRGERVSTVTESAIRGFYGPYAFLSNFHPCTVCIEGISFPSSEHAYMALKTLDREQRLVLAALSSPGKAKKFGRALKLRPDWDSFRLMAMLQVLMEKFKDPVLAKLLLATGDRYLEETNNWGDRFWGVDGEGANFLGKLLMLVRDHLRLTRPVVPVQEHLF